jgi:hypothetical protein
MNYNNNSPVTRVAMSLRNSARFGFGQSMGMMAGYFVVGIVGTLGLLGMYAGMENETTKKPRNNGLIIAGCIGILLSILIPFVVPRMMNTYIH